MAFHWLNPCQDREAFLLPVERCYHLRGWELPLLVSQFYFIVVSGFFFLHLKVTYMEQARVEDE